MPSDSLGIGRRRLLRKLLLTFGVSVLATDVTIGQYFGNREQLRVYLLLGQSNMAGRARTILVRDSISRCYLLNADDEWEPAKNPLNRYSSIGDPDGRAGTIGPGYFFAKTLLESDSDILVGLVVNARGGTSITQWQKGGRFYDEAIRRALIASRSGVLSGILWHQGEQDASDARYLRKLKKLIRDFRSDLRK